MPDVTMTLSQAAMDRIQNMTDTYNAKNNTSWTPQQFVKSIIIDKAAEMDVELAIVTARNANIEAEKAAARAVYE